MPVAGAAFLAIGARIVVIGLLEVVLDRPWTHRRGRGASPEPLAAAALAE
jgi:hypothetical protein